MPAGAAALRAEESATLERLVHERFTSPEIGAPARRPRPRIEDSLDPDSDEASLIRVTRRDWEKARKVPPSCAAKWRARGRGAACVGGGAEATRTSRRSCRT